MSAARVMTILILGGGFTLAGASSLDWAWMPPPADTGDTGDTGGAGGGDDTGEASDSGDTAADSGDTSADSGDTSADSGDSGSSDSASTDTADPVFSAAQVAGEEGGFGCMSIAGMAPAFTFWGTLVALAWRRRDEA